MGPFRDSRAPSCSPSPGPMHRLNSQGLAVIFSHHQVYIKKKKGGHFLGGSGIEYDKKLSKPLGI